MNSSVTITGSKGFIGSKFPEYQGVDLPDDICSLEFEGEGIIHCAAIPSVKRCDSNPEECVRVNVLGTLRVLEEAKKCGAWVVYISSKDANPDTLYGITKAAGEMLCQLYAKHIKVVIVRLCDVYGEGMDETKAYCVLKAKAESGEPITITNPDHVFDFMEVDEVCDRIRKIANNIDSYDSGHVETLTGRVVGIKEFIDGFNNMSVKE